MMSFKTKKESRRPTTADCAEAMEETDWALLKLTLAVRKVDYLIAKDKRKRDNFGKPWNKKNWFPLWPTYLIFPCANYLTGSMLSNLFMVASKLARSLLLCFCIY